ncbi:hypothetical protein NQ317_013130, partial [Molorchus minor]
LFYIVHPPLKWFGITLTFVLALIPPGNVTLDSIQIQPDLSPLQNHHLDHLCQVLHWSPLYLFRGWILTLRIYYANMLVEPHGSCARKGWLLLSFAMVSWEPLKFILVTHLLYSPEKTRKTRNITNSRVDEITLSFCNGSRNFLMPIMMDGTYAPRSQGWHHDWLGGQQQRQSYDPYNPKTTYTD